MANSPSVAPTHVILDSADAFEPIRSLGVVELLALVLARDPSGARQLQLSARTLDRAGGLSGLGRAGPQRLSRALGVHATDAWKLAACIELGRRVSRHDARPRSRLTTPAAVAGFLTSRIGGLDHEQLWVVSLDGSNRLRGLRQAARGGSHALIVTAREVLHSALCDAASGFILAHNHPSGDPTPSEADVDMTLTIAEAADIIGVPLLDHVIVTATGEYSSMLDLGVLTPPTLSSSYASQGQGARPPPSV